MEKLTGVEMELFLKKQSNAKLTKEDLTREILKIEMEWFRKKSPNGKLIREDFYEYLEEEYNITINVIKGYASNDDKYWISKQPYEIDRVLNNILSTK